MSETGNGIASGAPGRPPASTTPPADPYGAFCVQNHSALAATGSGTLDGLQFAIKDVFSVAGQCTGFGQPRWLASHSPSATTAPAIERLLRCGASLCGRTLSDELTYSLTGENIHYGTPVNPAAPDRVPGGSSNGSAVAVAAGMADFSLGTDCGGSVRLPASYCGIFGFRPSHGRVSLAGTIPFAPLFDTCGWFASDARVLEKVGRVLLDGRARSALGAPETLRLLIARDAFEQCTPPAARALTTACDGLRARFASHAHITLADDGLDTWRQSFQTLQAAAIWSNLGDWVTREQPQLGPGIRERFEAASQVGPEAVREAGAVRLRVRARMNALLPPATVLCIPTAPRPAPALKTPVDQVEIAFRNQAMELLCIAGLAGLPQVSLPLARLDGLPLGLSLVAAPGDDEQLLATARVLTD